MPASIRASTTVEGNTVTLNVAAMTGAPPPPPPPPFRVVVTRRGTVVTIKKGSINITIDIPANSTKPVVVDARGRAVCKGPATSAAKRGTASKGKKRVKKSASAKRTAPQTAAMTPPPPPDDKGA